MRKKSIKHLAPIYESTKSIWMVELRKFEPHLEYINNPFESRGHWDWDIFEERSSVGLIESVYLEIQCLVTYHHVCFRIPFAHYMADCYIGKAMKKIITKFVEKNCVQDIHIGPVHISYWQSVPQSCARFVIVIGWKMPELCDMWNFSKYMFEIRQQKICSIWYTNEKGL